MGTITVKFARPDNWQWVTIPVEDGRDPPVLFTVSVDQGGTLGVWPGQYTRTSVAEEDPPWIYVYQGNPIPGPDGTE